MNVGYCRQHSNEGQNGHVQEAAVEHLPYSHLDWRLLSLSVGP